VLLLARDVQERDDVKAGVFACCFNAASLRSFAEWKTEKPVHCRVLQSWGLETFGAEVV
jgi:hypothetical protein